MPLDPTRNFAKVQLTGGFDNLVTSVTVIAGDGAKLPAPATDGAFNLVWWNDTDFPDPSDDSLKEIVRCTARTTDTLTITRAQEGTTAQNHNLAGKTHKMILAPTKKTIDDIADHPLTTKGDISVFSTKKDRLPVGTNGQILEADSVQALGVKWAAKPAASPWTKVAEAVTGDVTSLALSGFNLVTDRYYKVIFVFTDINRDGQWVFRFNNDTVGSYRYHFDAVGESAGGVAINSQGKNNATEGVYIGAGTPTAQVAAQGIAVGEINVMQSSAQSPIFWCNYTNIAGTGDPANRVHTTEGGILTSTTDVTSLDFVRIAGTQTSRLKVTILKLA